MSGIASINDDVISVGKPLPRIAAVQVIDGRRLAVTWRDGTVKIVDLAPVLLSHRHFIPLRDNDDLFQTVRVNEDGVAIEWDGDIELTAEWIERLPPVGMDNTEFRKIMNDLDLTLEGAAAQLGVSRRQIAAFRGSKPIPSYIALAVRYLAEHGAEDHREAAPRAAPKPERNVGQSLGERIAHGLVPSRRG
jgi:hypothetical protein